MRSIALVWFLILFAQSAPAADIPPLPNVEIWMDHPGHVWVVPDGGGLSLDEAYGVDGGSVDATIHIILRDWNDQPIANYPAEDIWLEGGPGGELAICPGGTIADDDTDAAGHTTISGPFRAGGQVTPGIGPDVMVAGDAVSNMDLALTINSPDVNGDLEVSLPDIALLTYGLGAYDWRVDFNVDGQVNISDIAIFTPALAATCP